MKYIYIGNCAQLDGQLIGDMREKARDITRRTYLRKVTWAQSKLIEEELGYALNGSKGELTMANDWHISYHLSTYDGVRCVYFCWSGYEYVFVKSAEYAKRFAEMAARDIRPPTGVFRGLKE